jgi:hypothetical protein
MSKENESFGRTNAESAITVRLRNPDDALNTPTVVHPEYRWIPVDLTYDSLRKLETVSGLLNEELAHHANLRERGDTTAENERSINLITYKLATLKREIINRRKGMGRAETLVYKEFYNRAADMLDPETFQRILLAIPKEITRAAL